MTTTNQAKTISVEQTGGEGLSRSFKVTIPAAAIENRMTAKLEEHGQKVKMPGFRPGKVPMSILRKRYGPSVMGEVVQEAVTESSSEALSARELTPAAQPNIEITSFEEGGDLEYTMDLELMPEIEPVELSELKIARPVIEVPETEIADALSRMTEQHKDSRPIEESRPAAEGDVALIDFEGRVDGEAREGMAAQDFELDLGSGHFIEGFESQIIGLEPGAETTVTVTFPEEYGVEDLAGRQAEFAVTLKELREKVTPEIDADFAQKFGMESVDDLRGAVREQLEQEYGRLAKEVAKRRILDQLAERHDFELPAGMVDSEFEQIWHNFEHAREKGEISEADQAKSEEALKAEYRVIAERRVRLGLLFAELGRRAGVEVGQEEITRAILKEAQNYPGHEQEVFNYFQENPEAVSRLRAPLYEDKVVDYILEMAETEDQSMGPEQLKDELESLETAAEAA